MYPAKYFVSAAGCLAMALCLVGLAGCGQSDVDAGSDQAGLLDPDPIVFGVMSTESSTGLKKSFLPLMEDLEKEIGRKVQPRFASDYASMVEGMRFGQLHLAWMGNKTAMEAVDRANGEVFAQAVALGGAPGYWSVVIVHKDSPYQTIEDVIPQARQLTYGNGDPNSSSGYLVPNYYLWTQRGLDVNKLFKQVKNSNHEANCLAIANKQLDVATNNSESLKRFQNKMPDMHENIRVIWTSPLIPLDPILYHKNLEPELKEQIRQFFYNYGTEGRPDRQRELQVLAGLDSGWLPFKKSNNDQLIPTRELAIATKLSELEARPPSPATDSQIADLKAQLEELSKRRQQTELTLIDSEIHGE